jgi:LacI family transcriptional regulator
MGALAIDRTDNVLPPTRVRLQDIADRCHVAKITVSLALRHHPSVKASTAEHIRAVAQEMGYNPQAHEAARRLAAHKTGQRIPSHTLGIVLPPQFFDSIIAAPIYLGILESAVSAGYALVTTYFNFASLDAYQQQPVTPLPPIFASGGIDGLLLMDIQKDVQHILTYLAQGGETIQQPYVLMQQNHQDHPSVAYDTRTGAYELTRRLLALGHRHFIRFHHPRVAGNFDGADHGIRQALQEAGLAQETHLHFVTVPPDWMSGKPLDMAPEHAPAQQGQEIISMLRQHPEITAIMAWNDTSAIMTYRVLTDAGFRIPDQVSVAGFDDLSPLLNAQGKNILTSVRVPLTEVGRQAARMVIARINGDTTFPTQIVLPTEVMMRGTTGPARNNEALT